MKVHEYFVKRWEAEQAAFLKVLRAIPEGKLDYRPHERSTSAGALAWQLAEEQKQMSELIDRGETNFEVKPHPAAISEIVTAWQKATEELRGRVAKLDEAKAATPSKLLFNGQPVWTEALGEMLWGYLFDMIHHRGQLSTYLRPMGGKVPAIYGPSADDAGA